MIKDIVGEKVAARLKKSNITTIQQIKKILPGKLMSLAGIGPSKAQKLYRKAGVKYSLISLNRIYLQIQAKTQLKSVRKFSTDIIENPYKYIQKIDTIKEEVNALDNLAKSVYNFGRPQGEKLPLSDFQPVRTSISFDDQFTSKADADIGILEIFIDIKNDIEVISRYLGSNTAKILDKRNRTFPLNFSIQYLERIVSHIKAVTDSYLKQRGDSMVIITLAPEIIIIKRELQTALQSEIDFGAVLIADNNDEYKFKYSIFKFANNPAFIKLVDELEDRVARIKGFAGDKDRDSSTIDWMMQNLESNALIFEESGLKFVVGSLASFIAKDDKKIPMRIERFNIPNDKEKIQQFIDGNDIKLSNKWEIPAKFIYLINNLPLSFDSFTLNNKHILLEAKVPKGFGILILRGGLYE
jgi:hypothetical protein